MLEDPRVNFAISSGAKNPTIDHLGFQVDSALYSGGRITEPE